ncbi:NADPH-dependent FMN reductase [Streptomyces sp. NPDC003233]
MIRTGIIIGSTRPGRKGDRVAEWVRDLAAERAGDAADFDLVDLKEHALPLLDEAVPALMAPGERPHTRRWAERIGSYDAFIVVTPEYNAAPPASLTNAIDYLYAGWGGKPVAYVGYGIFGADFVNLTDFRPQELHVPEVHALVDELLTWGQALAPLGAGSAATA